MVFHLHVFFCFNIFIGIYKTDNIHTYTLIHTNDTRKDYKKPRKHRKKKKYSLTENTYKFNSDRTIITYNSFNVSICSKLCFVSVVVIFRFLLTAADKSFWNSMVVLKRNDQYPWKWLMVALKMANSVGSLENNTLWGWQSQLVILPDNSTSAIEPLPKVVPMLLGSVGWVPVMPIIFLPILKVCDWLTHQMSLCPTFSTPLTSEHVVQHNTVGRCL